MNSRGIAILYPLYVYPKNRMKALKINLLSGQYPYFSSSEPRKRRWMKPLITIFVIFIVSFGIGRVTYSKDDRLGWIPIDDIPIFGQMRHFILSADRSLAGENADRINILLMGMGGEGHEGPNLTDTLMMVSVKPSTNQVALLSIPRDLLIPIPGQGWRKINSANAFGEATTPGRGGEFARSTIEGLLGLDIPYYIRVDFNGFAKFVDTVGGLDVTVDKSFVDTTYPTENYGVQTVSFSQGQQRMNGKTALEFVRSRHGNNGEGSDFARAKRQQKILSALKEKLLTLRTFRNPTLIADMLATLRANVTTNLQIGEILRLAKIGQAIDRSKITNKVLDDSPGSPLMSSIYGGAYVLVPRGDDWNGLRNAAANVIPENVANTDTGASASTFAITSTSANDSSTMTIEIQNGTSKTGQAREIASKLTTAGFTVTKIGNADASYKKTTLYVLRSSATTGAIGKMKQLFPDAVIVSRPPATLARAVQSSDFLLILGADEL